MHNDGSENSPRVGTLFQYFFRSSMGLGSQRILTTYRGGPLLTSTLHEQTLTPLLPRRILYHGAVFIRTLGACISVRLWTPTRALVTRH